MQAVTFRDQNLEEESSQNGFVHIPKFLKNDELNYLYHLYQESHSETNDENIFWNSMAHSSVEKGLEIGNKIIAILQPRFKQTFIDAQLPLAYFVSKSLLPLGGFCPPHRDNTIFDETQNQYRNIWVPLVDTDIQNGTLFVVPQSHKLFTNQLPTRAEWPYRHLVPSLEKLYHPITAKAGDLVVYLDKTIHGSYANSSASRRPVIHSGVIHNSSREHMQYHLLNDEGNLEIYAVDPDFFIQKEFMDPNFRSKYSLIEKRKYQEANILTTEKIEEFFSIG